MKVAAYPQTCMLCHLGKGYGTLEYLGEGKFVHFDSCKRKLVPRVPRVYQPRILKPITVPQCSCLARQVNGECPYFSFNTQNPPVY